ncbi:hypothetical protein M8J77_004856 [Diaphorina citri]|nr:hypothetical protein M8J77_004856 [Diaphorina citri]KAI5734301.1 hypothetical protein M8J77_004856 [Diaphorina citri]
MSRALDNYTYPWSWSNCSRHYLTEFLDAGNAECLRDEPIKDYLSERRQLWPPGEHFTGDRQCELIHGKGIRLCSYMPVCQHLWCTSDEGEREGCHTQTSPWADGTPCYGATHWCQRGSCVARDTSSLRPRDGGWGPWQSFGSCSRPCGGGIKKSYRECSSPAPANGGKYCVGKRVRYRSCNTRDCAPGTMDFREEQCVKFNGNNFSVPGLSRNVKWTPKYLGGDNACKLYCRVAQSSAYYLLKDKVIDGTPCGPDTFDVCINGKCMKAGCNHVLDSDSKLDFCGVCEGNNQTCQEIRGSHNTSQYGYTRVLRIPAGSSNLDITQYGYGGTSSDDNYLALSDGETNEPILNGKNVVSKSHKVIVFGGIAIDYTGTDAVVERINCSRPLTKELIVEVLSVGNLYPPNIHYRYTVQRGSPNEYKWTLSPQWSICSKVCNGMARRDPVCIRIEDNAEVADHMCPSEEDRPEPEMKPCNNHCILKWQVISQSECSAHCGPGTRSVSLQCVQHFPASSQPPQPLHNATCADLPRPAEREPCEGPCNAARWKFSPWGTCSKSCGTGVETRSAVCIDDYGREVDESQCSAAEKIIQRVCGTSKCPQWSVDKWSACSVSCGKGERRREIWCQRDNHVVHDSYCADDPVPARKEICYMAPCPEWITGQFSACSVTCGEGTATRDVRCNLGDDSLCASIPRPPSVETCVVHPCDEDTLDHYNDIPGSRYDMQDSPYYLWRHGHWTECSAACGEGERKRQVGCYNKSSGKQVDDYNCPQKSKPHSKEVCKSQPCASWRSSEWSACSTSCGQGVMRRKVQCVDSSNQDQVDEKYCLDPRPVEEVPCYATSGCVTPSSYSWRTSRWSECSAACGRGTRRRVVECYNELNQPGRSCDMSTKPEATGWCNEHPCVTGSWIYGAWSQCNTTCGAGYQHRLVECQDTNGITLAESSCPQHTKPDLTFTFSNSSILSSCYPVVTLHVEQDISTDWSSVRIPMCNTTCGAGYQHRLVECQDTNGITLAESSCPQHTKPDLTFTFSNSSILSSCYPVVTLHVEQDISTDWSSVRIPMCNTTCGAGYQHRLVECQDTNGITLAESSCPQHTKPDLTFTFSNSSILSSCYPVVTLHVEQDISTDWSSVRIPMCNTTCGAGYQHRLVECQDTNGITLAESSCPQHTKPDRQQPCNLQPCVEEMYKWKPSAWEPCTASCGQGIRSRKLTCVSMSTGASADPSKCQGLKMPKTERHCMHIPCSIDWVGTEWSNCSVSCGSGKQTRDFSCRRIRDNTSLPHHQCDGRVKPPAVRVCQMEPCNAAASDYYWVPGHWQEASALTTTPPRQF